MRSERRISGIEREEWEGIEIKVGIEEAGRYLRKEVEEVLKLVKEESIELTTVGLVEYKGREVERKKREKREVMRYA